ADAVQTGRWPAVLVTLELLPEETRRAHPDLSLVEARALSITGHPQEALAAAESALAHGGRSGDESVQLSALLELATVTFPTDMAMAWDWLSAAEHILRNSANLPDHRKLEGRALGVRGVLSTLAGDVSDARSA